MVILKVTKTGLHPLSRGYIFPKRTGGGGGQIDLPSSHLRVKIHSTYYLLHSTYYHSPP